MILSKRCAGVAIAFAVAFSVTAEELNNFSSPGSPECANRSHESRRHKPAWRHFRSVGWRAFNPDPVQAARELDDFVSLLSTAAVLEKRENSAILLIGSESWPFPVPLVERDGRWFFDTLAGKEEIINRRIGHNEVIAIGVCRAYLTAQRRYASQDRDGRRGVGVRAKARKFPGPA